MRYSKDHKQQTYNNMVAVASRHFRSKGYDGVAIGDLMSELELTHGGFYRHFSSKEALYIEALGFSIEDAQNQLMGQATAADQTSLRQLIRAYLSIDHCAEPGAGCPVAALSAEIARQSDDVRHEFDVALAAYMDRFLDLMPGTTPTERQQQFLVLFSGMAGALSVARAVADPELSASILETARNFYEKTYCE